MTEDIKPPTADFPSRFLKGGGSEHELKCWPRYFHRLRSGEKAFEVRKDDRDFEVGDVLLIREWDPASGDYTNSMPLRFNVTDVLRPYEHGGVTPGFCVMSLQRKWR